MAVHQLKTWTTYFRDMEIGRKTFEIRKNDRYFMLGDLLVCREWDPDTEKYSGKKLYFRVTYITDAQAWQALSKDFVCMGLTLLKFPLFLVLSTAQERGVELTDDEAGWLLWNETGYPSFWNTNMETDIRLQIVEWCEKKKERHG